MITRLRGFFNSMSGRMFLILLFGSGISASVALLLAETSRRSELREFHLERSADRIQDFVALLNKADEDLRRQLSVDGARGIRVARSSAVAGAPDPAFTARLQRRLHLQNPYAQDAASDVCRPPDHDHGGDNTTSSKASNVILQPPDCWLVSVSLADGSRVRLAAGSPPLIIGRAHVFDPLYLVALALGAAAIAFPVARMAAAPLARLSKAATDLGRDLDSAPLPETGPDEVRNASRAFNAMQQRLRQTVSERTHMLAAITHDLQTPLTRLRLKLENIDDADLKARLMSDWAAMQALIREGLDLARSEDTNELFALLDLDSLIESIVSDENDLGRNAMVSATCGRDVRVRPQALRRCIANLVDNALAYAGSVEIGAAADGPHTVITVRDHGPGIPEDRLEAVFEPLVRLETSRSRETGGIGLGLTIARALAAKNGARLRLANHPGGGLIATLTLDSGARPV